MTTRRQLEDAFDDVLARVALGISLTSAIEDVCGSVGMTPEELGEELEVLGAGEVAIAAAEVAG